MTKTHPERSARCHSRPLTATRYDEPETRMTCGNCVLAGHGLQSEFPLVFVISKELLERLLAAAPHDDHGHAILTNARFDRAIFQYKADFSGATFQRGAWFVEATFQRGVRFDGALSARRLVPRSDLPGGLAARGDLPAGRRLPRGDLPGRRQIRVFDIQPAGSQDANVDEAATTGARRSRCWTVGELRKHRLSVAPPGNMGWSGRSDPTHSA